MAFLAPRSQWSNSSVGGRQMGSVKGDLLSVSLLLLHREPVEFGGGHSQ